MLKLLNIDVKKGVEGEIVCLCGPLGFNKHIKELLKDTGITVLTW
jgi:hypothetical protein